LPCVGPYTLLVLAYESEVNAYGLGAIVDQLAHYGEVPPRLIVELDEFHVGIGLIATRGCGLGKRRLCVENLASRAPRPNHSGALESLRDKEPNLAARDALIYVGLFVSGSALQLGEMVAGPEIGLAI